MAARFAAFARLSTLARLAAVVAIALGAVRGAGAGPSKADRSLDDVRDRGVLRYAIDPAGGAPFAMPKPDAPDELDGFEVELMELVGRRLGVRVEPVVGDWLALVDMVKAGRADVAFNGFEYTDERAASTSFTARYYVFDQVLTVRAADAGRFAGLDDLRGDAATGPRPIGVLNGSGSVDVLREDGWPDERIRQYDDGLSPYADLKAMRVDGVLQDSIVAAYYAGGDAALRNLPPLGRPGHYAGVVRDDAVALRAAIDAALEELKRSGELARLYRAWRIWTTEQASIGIVDAPGDVPGDMPADAPGDAPAAADARGSRAEAADGREAARAFRWSTTLVALAKACVTTLALTALAMPAAVAIGIALAVAARSGRPILARVARAYVAVVRGTPLLVQLYLVYYSLPALGLWLADEAPSLDGWLRFQELLTWPSFAVAVLVLAGNYGAYEAEVQRAGLEAVPDGQRRAALALGLSRRQSLWRIELPQGFRLVLPATINDLNSMLKDSSLVSLIAVPELMQVALGIGKATFMVPAVLVAAAGYYLVLSLGADVLARRLAHGLGRRPDAGAATGLGTAGRAVR